MRRKLASAGGTAHRRGLTPVCLCGRVHICDMGQLACGRPSRPSRSRSRLVCQWAGYVINTTSACGGILADSAPPIPSRHRVQRPRRNPGRGNVVGDRGHVHPPELLSVERRVQATQAAHREQRALHLAGAVARPGTVRRGRTLTRHDRDRDGPHDPNA